MVDDFNLGLLPVLVLYLNADERPLDLGGGFEKYAKVGKFVHLAQLELLLALLYHTMVYLSAFQPSRSVNFDLYVEVVFLVEIMVQIVVEILGAKLPV